MAKGRQKTTKQAQKPASNSPKKNTIIKKKPIKKQSKKIQANMEEEPKKQTMLSFLGTGVTIINKDGTTFYEEDNPVNPEDYRKAFD